MPNAQIVSVLHIDDEISICNEIQELLALRKIDCSTACHIEDAREILKRDPFRRIVVLDFNMPGITGAEVIDLLRSEFDRELAFIVLTGDETQAVAVESFRAQAMEFLRKPVDAKALVQAINRARETLTKPNAPFEIKTRSFFSALPDLSQEVQDQKKKLKSMVSVADRASIEFAPQARATLDSFLNRPPAAKSCVSGSGRVAEIQKLETAVADAQTIHQVLHRVATNHDVLNDTAFIFRSIDMTDFVGRLARILEPFARNRGVSLEVRPPKFSPPVQLDELRLNKAIADIFVTLLARFDREVQVVLTALVDSERHAILRFELRNFHADPRFLYALWDESAVAFLDLAQSDKETIGLLASRLVIALHGGYITAEVFGDDKWLQIHLPTERVN